MLPPPTASVDVIGRQAPRSERQIDESTKHEKEAPTGDKRNQRPDTTSEEE